MSDAPVTPTPDLAAMAAAALQSMKPKLLWTTINHWDQDGMRIEERIIERGERPKDFALFVAHGAISYLMPIGTTKEGKLVEEERKANIKADLLDAVDKFDAAEKGLAALKLAADAWSKDFEAKKLAAQKKADEQVGAKNTRKLLTQGL